MRAIAVVLSGRGDDGTNGATPVGGGPHAAPPRAACCPSRACLPTPDSLARKAQRPSIGMKLRIARETARSGITLIRVDGELVGEGVGELEKVCDAVDGPLQLDLTNLRSADARGLGRIRALVGRGASLRGVSPYIALLLDGDDPRGRDGCP